MAKRPATSLACLYAAAFSFVGVLNMPYGYYTLLRLVVCVCSVVAGVALLERRLSRVALLAWGMAIVYNPIIRVSLDKDLWRVLNVASAVALIVIAARLNEARPASSSASSETS
jgi:hypothetical protein